MSTKIIACWSCQAPYDTTGGVFRSTTCPACEEDLHACLQCVHYDSGVNQSCREPMSEWVKAKDRTNFCVYFHANPTPGVLGKDDSIDDAKKKLNDLFNF